MKILFPLFQYQVGLYFWVSHYPNKLCKYFFEKKICIKIFVIKYLYYQSLFKPQVKTILEKEFLKFFFYYFY